MIDKHKEKRTFFIDKYICDDCAFSLKLDGTAGDIVDDIGTTYKNIDFFKVWIWKFVPYSTVSYRTVPLR